MRRGDDDSRLLLGDARAFAAFYRRHEDAVLGRVIEERGQCFPPPGFPSHR